MRGPMRTLLALTIALGFVAIAHAQRPMPGGGSPGGPMRQGGGPGGFLGPAEWSNLRGQSHEPFIDTHTHLDGMLPMGSSDWEGAAQTALTVMQSLDVTKSFVMSPPFPAGNSRAYDHEAYGATVTRHSDRFGFLAGGGSLNPMIQEAIAAGSVSSALRQRFEERAERIVRDGALGFGEMAAEHLSFSQRHPYEGAPPDHPLFLLLADVAARRNVVIDLHMEAVTRDMPTPPRFMAPNPPTLKENISGLERLLAHNRDAKIVWVHAGWDNTGHFTPALMKRLLETHPNLFFSVKVDQMSPPDTRPFTANGLKPEWIDVVRAFPDRFVLGTDSFYSSPRFPLQRPTRGDGVRAFLDQLPAELARKIGTENVVRLYNLK